MLKAAALLALLLACSTCSAEASSYYRGAIISSKVASGTSSNGRLSIHFDSAAHPEYPNLNCVVIRTDRPKTSIVLVIDKASLKIGDDVGCCELFADSAGCLAIVSISSSPETIFYVKNPIGENTSALCRTEELAADLEMNQFYLFNSDGVSRFNMPALPVKSLKDVPSRVFLKPLLPVLREIAERKSKPEEVPDRKWKSDPFVEQTVDSYRQRKRSLFGEEYKFEWSRAVKRLELDEDRQTGNKQSGQEAKDDAK